jgi:TonB family protein
MHIVVDEHGVVRLATVDTSSGAEYTKATTEAVQKWTFEPAKLDGQPVAVLVVIETRFQVIP